MKQAVLTEIGKLSIMEVPRPQCDSGEVLLFIEACGICGSDIHIFQGHHPIIKPPVVMGHEICGHIADKGDGVENFSVGDKVFVIPTIECGHCQACESGHTNRCRHSKIVGGQFPGGFSEYITVRADKLIRLSDTFTSEQGALIEATAVAVHAVRRLKSVEGLDVLVIGAGPIGLLTLQVLKAYGAKRVAVSDPVEQRLELARKLGPDFLFNPEKDDLVQSVFANMNEEGIDAAFDCAGREITLTQALNLTRNGGEIVLTAIFDKDPIIPIKMLQRGERHVLGVQAYVRSDFEIAIELIAEGKINVADLITHKFPLEQIDQAFKTATDRIQMVGKVIVLNDEVLI